MESTVGLDLLPLFLRESYEIHEWKHATAVLTQDFATELRDIVEILTRFRLFESQVATPGGHKSQVASAIDSAFYARGWLEKGFETQVTIDGVPYPAPTHKVDCFRNEVGLEVEWNNKDPFFDRDLNNFRLLFDLRALSVGVMITRSDELQDIFDELGRGDSYGQSTTHMSKLLPKVQGGGSGGCPLLVFGITKRLYVRRK
jgi:hypothetical protein